MKKPRYLSRICLFLLVALAVPAPPLNVGAHQPGTPTPTLTVRGQNPMDPHPATMDIPPLTADYTLAARVSERRTDGAVRVDGTVRVLLRNTGSRPVERPTFNVPSARYGWFALESGSLDGVAATVDQADVRLNFPDWTPLAPNMTRTVGFAFHLDIRDAGDGWDACRLDGDVLRLAYWFPMLSDDHGYTPRIDPAYTASGDFHVTLSAPAGWVLAATGGITKEETAAGRVTYSVEATKVRDWVGLLSPSFAVTQGKTAGGVAVRVLTVPSHFAALTGRVEAIRDAAITGLERMSEWVGPYPYPVFTIADAGLSMPGGIEFPTLIMIGPRDPDWRVLIAHEVAHQWFYGILGTRTQAEPWVDEGAAAYFERAIYAGLVQAPSLSRPLPCAVSVSVWDETIPARDLDTCAYSGGRAVYATIATALGPERFARALHELYDTHRYGIVSAREMLTIFQRHSPTDLRSLLRPYLDYDWLPALPPPG